MVTIIASPQITTGVGTRGLALSPFDKSSPQVFNSTNVPFMVAKCVADTGREHPESQNLSVQIYLSSRQTGGGPDT